ncbi:MAG: S9 family peptidase [Pseudomonadota bacterium]
MNKNVARLLRRLALGALTVLGIAANAAPVPIAHFFGNPAVSAAVLAPDAKSLAVLVDSDAGRDRLAVLDLATNKITIVASFGKADVRQFQWINNNRLVFDSGNKHIGAGDTRSYPGMYAVDRDGKNFKQLVEKHVPEGDSERQVASTILPYNHFLAGHKGSEDSDAVYVHSPKWKENGELRAMNLVRIDTVTGRATTVQRPGSSQGWLLDYKGEPRLSVTLEKNIESVQYLDPASKAWRELASFDGFLGGKGAFTPLGFAPDGTLYVLADAGKDKVALHTFDVKTGKLNPTPVVALEDFDFSGSLITSGDKLLGVRYLSDAKSTVWMDDTMKAVQAKVDALLPGTVNLIDVPARPAMPLVLVTSYSDRQPVKYMLFNTATGALSGVGEAHAAIKAAEMGEQEIVRIKARDGLMIPAWLTLPAGSKRKDLPLVVLVHGGPYARGVEWGWSSKAQFLASRGYAVLEPEFRGSTGYGAHHYTSGWKQWGLAMQNDIADSTRWAIAQGIVDPKRICIAGASYGGYATLMGLANDPDLYKCGVSWVGVTDLKLLYSDDWSFTSDNTESYRKYGMPTLVGDPVKDAAQLKATSPLTQAARIKQPLLMAYGAVDRRVPLSHGRLFYSAVQAHNQDVEMIVYDEEAHGWTLPKNRIDFWTRVEKFLDKHIGKP